jgi:deazaflavin-dependent oxidoreductase (nitroreductase family)
MAENTFADMNSRIIAEFRANAGAVGGGFAGAPIILLTITGAKSGKTYVTPLVDLADGDGWVIIASKGGAPTNPDCYHNLKANPNLTIEVGSDTIAAVATEVTGAERDELYAKQAAVMPQFDEYAKGTTRVIPVFRLARA